MRDRLDEWTRRVSETLPARWLRRSVLIGESMDSTCLAFSGSTIRDGQLRDNPARHVELPHPDGNARSPTRCSTWGSSPSIA
jgi:hypothetical protein